MKGFFQRTKRLIGVLAVVALLAAGGAWYYYGRVLPSQVSSSASAEAVKTARVRRGNLTISASGTGVLVPVARVGLGFRTGGVLAEVPVEVGERVAAGDILAQIDRAALERSVIQSEIALRQAEIRLEDAQDPPDDADIQRAKDGVDQAAAALGLAQIDYEAAQSNVAVNESLEDARSAYQEALNVYNYWLNQHSAGEADYWWVDDAKQTLDEAQLALSRAQQQADKIVQSAGNDLARATDVYNQAQSDLGELLDGPDTGDIESLELDVLTAQLNLAAARENLANATLTAPFAGVIVTVEAEVGETVGTAPIIVLADLDHPLVRLNIDEADLDKIALGCEVQVIFDALPDEIYGGHVAVIEPELTLIDGVPTIQALAILDGENTGEARFLPSGLNAGVEVIGGKAEGALLVPVEALKELAPGNYSVFVVVDGQLNPRPVQVGLMDISYAEITGGLEQGEIVSTGAVETE